AARAKRQRQDDFIKAGKSIIKSHRRRSMCKWPGRGFGRCDHAEAGNWIRDSRGRAVSALYGCGKRGIGAWTGRMGAGARCGTRNGNDEARRVGARRIWAKKAAGAFGWAAAKSWRGKGAGGGPSDSADG